MTVLYVNWVQILIDLICFFGPLFLLVAFAARWHKNPAHDEPNEEEGGDDPQSKA